MDSTAARCAHCGKQRAGLKRCSVCKQASYCGATCQNAGWKKHKKICAPPLSLVDICAKIDTAVDADDDSGLLEWEGRLEDLMEGQSDASCDTILQKFIGAHSSLHRCQDWTRIATLDSAREHALASVRLQERRIKILGKMQRFRDQGEAICDLATGLLDLKSRFGKHQSTRAPQHLEDLNEFDDASKHFERARAVGAAHGFFSVESRACLGLGNLATREGPTEEGADLLRNALAAVNYKP